MKDRSTLSDWQIVCKVQAIHPDWTVADHVAYLAKEEGRHIDPIWVGRWLQNIVADQRPQPRWSHSGKDLNTGQHP
jgi:hypothetical protein